MELSLRGWKPGQLLLGWAAYWVGLVGVTLSPAISATLRATRLPEGHGNITAGFNDSVLTYTVIENGVKTWAGSASLSTMLLWIAGPPLLLWLVWLVMRGRPEPVPLAGGSSSADALPPGEGPAAEWRPRNDRTHVEPGRVRTPNP